MYLNDIEDYFILNGFEGVDIGHLKMFLLLYADDIVILSETEDGLHKGLLLLESYCDKWRLTVNIKKTKIMIFRKGRLRQNISFFYKGEKLEIVEKFTYLGIVFTTGGSFNNAFETLSGQAIKALHKLQLDLNKFPCITVKHKLDLFDKLISPILNYASEVSGIYDCSKLEKVHLHFCKKLLGVRIQTQNNFIYGELGRTSLKCTRIINVIKYWLKIIQLDDIKYVKKIYDLLYSQLDIRPNKKSWVSDVRDILQSLGFNDVWLLQGVGNVDIFINVIKQRANDVFVQNWFSELHSSTRARSYLLFADFKLQKYLKCINIDKFRIALSRLRVSSHRLENETGRWNKPIAIPFHDRKCKHCSILEDEFHFILECSLYTALRKKYINKYFWKSPNIPKFIELMQSENEIETRNLSMYILKAFELRNNILYDQ